MQRVRDPPHEDERQPLRHFPGPSVRANVKRGRMKAGTVARKCWAVPCDGKTPSWSSRSHRDCHGWLLVKRLSWASSSGPRLRAGCQLNAACDSTAPMCCGIRWARAVEPRLRRRRLLQPPTDVAGVQRVVQRDRCAIFAQSRWPPLRGRPDGRASAERGDAASRVQTVGEIKDCFILLVTSCMQQPPKRPRRCLIRSSGHTSEVVDWPSGHPSSRVVKTPLGHRSTCCSVCTEQSRWVQCFFAARRSRVFVTKVSRAAAGRAGGACTIQSSCAASLWINVGQPAMCLVCVGCRDRAIEAPCRALQAVVPWVVHGPYTNSRLQMSGQR